MPYANNRGVSIHYEVEGEGAPLVLIPGLAGNTIAWRETGYVKEKTQGPVASAEEKARRARFLLNDYKALYALYQNMSSLPAVGDLLPHISVPCLLYADRVGACSQGRVRDRCEDACPVAG